MQAWGLTDPGCVRVQNQDAYGVHTFEEDSLLCTVCDGMGGAKSGNVASSLALQIFMQEVTRLRKPGMSQEQAGQMFREAVRLANFTVYDQSRQFEDFEGMGTISGGGLCGSSDGGHCQCRRQPVLSSEPGRSPVPDDGPLPGAADGPAGGTFPGAG